jgi:hypothetical protein
MGSGHGNSRGRIPVGTLAWPEDDHDQRPTGPDAGSEAPRGPGRDRGRPAGDESRPRLPVGGIVWKLDVQTQTHAFTADDFKGEEREGYMTVCERAVLAYYLLDQVLMPLCPDCVDRIGQAAPDHNPYAG